MARDLYGSAGSVIVIGVSVSSVAAGELPTPQVARAIPFVVDLVLQLARLGGAALSGLRGAGVVLVASPISGVSRTRGTGKMSQEAIGRGPWRPAPRGDVP
jgi:hypothetical protein